MEHHPEDQRHQEAAAALLVLPAHVEGRGHHDRRRSRQRRHGRTLRSIHVAQPAGLLGRRLGLHPRHLVHLPRHAARSERRSPTTSRRASKSACTSTRSAPTTRRHRSRSFFSTQLAQFATGYPPVPPPTTNRTHCIAWSDYTSQAQTSFTNGIRFDTNYYYWPAPWVADRPGMFTGSGMPMRFATSTGR